MKSEHKKYIEANIGKKPIGQIAKELGLKERKIRKYLESIKVEKPEAGPVEVSTPAGPVRRGGKYIFILLLIIMVTASYANIVTGGVVWDDQTIGVRNEAKKNFDNL